MGVTRAMKILILIQSLDNRPDSSKLGECKNAK